MRAGAQPLGVAGGHGQFQRRGGNVHVQVGHVRGQFHVNGEFAPPSREDEPVNLGGHVVGPQLRLRDRHLRENPQEVVSSPIGKGVVHHQTALGGSERRRAADADYGNVLAAGARDAVEGAQGPDTVGDDEDGQPVQPCVAVGGISGVEFIASPDPGQRAVLLQLLREHQVVITGNTKKVRHAGLTDTPEEKLTRFHPHHAQDKKEGRVLSSRFGALSKSARR